MPPVMSLWHQFSFNSLLFSLCFCTGVQLCDRFLFNPPKTCLLSINDVLLLQVFVTDFKIAFDSLTVKAFLSRGTAVVSLK